MLLGMCSILGCSQTAIVRSFPILSNSKVFVHRVVEVQWMSFCDTSHRRELVPAAFRVGCLYDSLFDYFEFILCEVFTHSFIEVRRNRLLISNIDSLSSRGCENMRSDDQRLFIRQYMTLPRLDFGRSGPMGVSSSSSKNRAGDSQAGIGVGSNLAAVLPDAPDVLSFDDASSFVT